MSLGYTAPRGRLIVTSIRHITVLVLGCVLLTLALSACGRGPSEVDIEATVVARIEEKQAEDAALEAMAKAMVEAVVNQQHWDRSGPERIVVMESQR